MGALWRHGKCKKCKNKACPYFLCDFWSKIGFFWWSELGSNSTQSKANGTKRPTETTNNDYWRWKQNDYWLFWRGCGSLRGVRRPLASKLDEKLMKFSTDWIQVRPVLRTKSTHQHCTGNIYTLLASEMHSRPPTTVGHRLCMKTKRFLKMLKIRSISELKNRIGDLLGFTKTYIC